MSSINEFQNILSKLKHLRGRHDQRDHAWNRGMGRGDTSGGYAPGTMNQDQFMEMKRSLQSQIDSGAMSYEVGSAIWKRAQEIANQDYDARPENRREAFISQQRTIANDIQEGVIAGALANRNTPTAEALKPFEMVVIEDMEPSVERGIQRIIKTANEFLESVSQSPSLMPYTRKDILQAILSRTYGMHPYWRETEDYITEYFFENQKENMAQIVTPKIELSPLQQNPTPTSSSTMPDIPLTDYPVVNETFVDSLRNLNEQLRKQNPWGNIDKYENFLAQIELNKVIANFVKAGMTRFDATAKVNGIVNKLELSNLQNVMDSYLETALIEDRKDNIDEHNKWMEILYPFKENQTLNKKQQQELSDKFDILFSKKLTEATAAARKKETVNQDNDFAMAAIAAMQELTLEEQKYVATFPSVIDMTGSSDERRSEKNKRVRYALLIGGSPEIRSYVNTLIEQTGSVKEILEARTLSLQHFIDQGKKLGWQWFSAELMTTHAISKVGWMTAEMQEMLAKIGPNKGLDPADIPNFYPEFMNVPKVDPAAVDALQKAYEYQQEYLKKTFKLLRLYRTARMQLGLPFESWSRQKNIAEDFRTAYGGTLYEQLVPLENVFCFDITLPGWPTGVYQEEEVVVLGHAQMEHMKKKKAAKKSTTQSTTKSKNNETTSGWSFDYDPYQNWYLPEFRLQPEIYNVPELPNKSNTTLQLKSVASIKERVKHLRGRHDQRDHAWNRGMGRGDSGGGYAPGYMTQPQFMEMKRSLQSQIDSGAMSYEVGSAIWKRAQEIANQDYDTRPANRREAFISQQTAGQNIANAAQSMTLQNQVPREYTDAYEVFLEKVRKEVGEMQASSIAEIAQDPKKWTRAFRSVLEGVRPSDNPRTGQYDMIPRDYINMPRDVYNYVVNKLLGEMIKTQLREDQPKTLEKAVPIARNPNRPYIFPKTTTVYRNPVAIADKIIDDFKKLKEEDQFIEFNVVEKHNYVVSMIQNLSVEDQLDIISNADAIEKLRENDMLEEVQVAIGAFGHPDARFRVTEIAQKEDPKLFEALTHVNLEWWMIAPGGGLYASDAELRKKITELVRYGTSNLTGAHLQQAFMQVGPNKSIPIDKRRHFFEEGVVTPEPHPRILKIMNDMYEETQRRFKEEGVTEVRLYRGGPLQGGLPYEPWSAEQETALSFSGLRFESDKSREVRDMRTAIVPVEYIFSNYVYSHFHAKEFEFPVLAQAMYADQNVDVEIMKTGADFVRTDLLRGQESKEITKYFEYLKNERINKRREIERLATEKPRDDALKTILGTSDTFSLSKKYFPTEADGAYANLNEKTISIWESQLKILNKKFAEIAKTNPKNEAKEKMSLLYMERNIFRENAKVSGIHGTKEYFQVMKIYQSMAEKYESLADQIERKEGVLESVLGTDENFSLDKENYPRLDDETIYNIDPWSIKQWAGMLPGLNEDFARLYKKQLPESSIGPQVGYVKNSMKLEALRFSKNIWYNKFSLKEKSPQIYNDILRIFDTMIHKYEMEQTRFAAEISGMTLQEYMGKKASKS